MSNTLETKTLKQLIAALRSYNSYMCEIPNSFIVLDEYLQGLSQFEFCSAFKALQNIVINIYNYLQENPQSIGLVKFDRKTGELKVQTSQHISCIKKLLYAIGRISVLDSGSLVISMDSLMNNYMTYYSNCSVELAESVTDFDKDKQKLPDEYRNGIGKCHGCKKGDCNGRTFITAAGKKYALCNGAWWGFPPSYDAVPYIVAAYRI